MLLTNVSLICQRQKKIKRGSTQSLFHCVSVCAFGIWMHWLSVLFITSELTIERQSWWVRILNVEFQLELFARCAKYFIFFSHSFYLENFGNFVVATRQILWLIRHAISGSLNSMRAMHSNYLLMKSFGVHISYGARWRLMLRYGSEQTTDGTRCRCQTDQSPVQTIKIS